MQDQIAKGAEEHIFERHTPGQSLTNSTEEAMPWEKSPQMTSVNIFRFASRQKFSNCHRFNG